jgi:hypothetical protein
MIHCKINTLILPLEFGYEKQNRTRMIEEDTISHREFFLLGHSISDIRFSFNLPYSDEDTKNYFEDLFENQTIFDFYDYDGNTWKCLISELNIKEESGYYSLSGVFQCVEV